MSSSSTKKPGPSNHNPGNRAKLIITPRRIGPPRLDSNARLLGRFYEPLFLLRVLGQTRGEHTPSPPDHSAEQARRRNFLRNLSYICDFEKGGGSCTAIGLEDSETCYTFWIASNTANDKTIEFAKVALDRLKTFASHESQDPDIDQDLFVNFCLGFAANRVKEESRCLFRAIKQCYSRSEDVKTDKDRVLKKVLDTILKHDDMFNLCRHAYSIRKSALTNILASRAQEQEQPTRPPGKRSSFKSVHHYIGRLASHIRAPQQLVDDAGHFTHVLESYKVCAIPYLPCVPRPVPDAQTTLHGILNRMLARGDPERPRIEGSLLHMNTQSGILDTYMEQYEKCTPQIHAEVQALEHFYMMNLSFVGNDRYVACSKPACLCCELYFKYHPARMVIPESHRKVWINWGPPLVTSSKKSDPEYKRQLKVLNGMTAEIRQMAIAQILGQSSYTPWHPDSRTGISDDRWSRFDPGDIADNPQGHTAVEAALGEQATETGSQVASWPDQGEVNCSDEDSDSEAGGVSVIVGDS